MAGAERFSIARPAPMNILVEDEAVSRRLFFSRSSDSAEQIVDTKDDTSARPALNNLQSSLGATEKDCISRRRRISSTRPADWARPLAFLESPAAIGTEAVK